MLRSFTVVITAALVAFGGARADRAEQTLDTQALAATIRADRARAADLSWRERVEIYVDAELLSREFYVVEQAGDGMRRRRIDDAPERVAPEERGRKARRLAESLAELENSARAILEEYLEFPRDAVRKALPRSRNWFDSQAGAERIQIRGLRRAGDTVDVWMADGAMRPARAAVFTSLGGEAYRITVEFAYAGERALVVSAAHVETELGERQVRIDITRTYT